MTTDYPGALDSFSAVTDGVDTVSAALQNNQSDAIEAIQTELGTDPAGAYTDVNERLNALETGVTIDPDPSADNTYQGLTATMTVDTNAEGIGAPLFMAADGHLDTADADATTTAPCVALALETGTGSKLILLMGALRHNAWNWTTGPGAASLIYVSTTTGTLTQTAPSGTDDVVQPVGWALTDDMIFFNPSMVYITHT